MRVLSPDELYLGFPHYYATYDLAPRVTVAPRARAAERPHGHPLAALPFLNLTQKHTAQLAALRAAYARTFARPAPAPSLPLIAVGPVRETLPLPAALDAAATVILYPASPVAAVAAVAFRTAGAAALPARYINLALLFLARPSPPPSASPGLTASPGRSRRLRRCPVQTLWEAGRRRRCPSRVEINNRSFCFNYFNF